MDAETEVTDRDAAMDSATKARRPVNARGLGCTVTRLAPASRVVLKVRHGQRLSDRHANRSFERLSLIDVKLPAVRLLESPVPLDYMRGRVNAVYNDSCHLLTPELGLPFADGPRDLQFARQTAAIAARGRLRPTQRIDGRGLWCINEGSSTWGHWVVQTLPRALMFIDRFADGKLIVPASYAHGKLQNFGACLLAAGVPRERIVLAGPRDIIRVERPVLISMPYAAGLPHPLALEHLRALRNRSLGEAPESPINSERLYIDRIKANREIINAHELRPLLDRAGFASVSNGSLSLPQQIALWNRARSVVGVMGSDLTNLVFGNIDRLFVLTPAWFGDRFFYGLAASLGVEWNELICGQKMIERQPQHKSAFCVDPECFATLLGAS